LQPLPQLLLINNSPRACRRQGLAIQFSEEIAIMSTLPTQNVYSKMRDLRWSPNEKTIARRAFDRTLHRELEATIQKAKQIAARIKEPDELWNLNAI
jgi:hypothetical protein